MFTRMLEHGAIGIINEKLLNYRRTAGQVSSSYSLSMTEENEFFRILDAYIQPGVKAGTISKDVLKVFKVRRQVDMSVRVMNLMKLGKLKEARKLYRESVSWHRIAYSFKSKLSMFSLLASTILFFIVFCGPWKNYGGSPVQNESQYEKVRFYENITHNYRVRPWRSREAAA